MFITQLDKFPSHSLFLVREKFSSSNQKQQEALNFANFKNPTVTLMLGIFLGMFGADRFYIGSMGIGALKAFILFFIFVVLGIIDAAHIDGAMSEGAYDDALGISVLIVIIYLIFVAVDIFLSFKACKEKNLQAFIEILEIYKEK